MTDQAAALRALMSAAVASEPKNARVYAVASGKGGVGKSTVVANLGVAFASRGLRTVILDGDLGLANIDVLLDLYTPYTVSHVVKGQKSLEEIMVEGPFGLKVIPGGSGLTSLVNMDREARLRLLGQLARVGAKSDMILIDTPAGIGQDVIGLAIAAESVLVVATPEPTSITDAYALIKVIWQESSNANFQVLVNQASSEVTARAASEQLTTVARRFLKIDVPTLGYLPVDPNVPKSIRRQETVITAFPNSLASKGFMAIADRLMEDGVAAERHSRVFGFVRRLARRGERAAAF